MTKNKNQELPEELIFNNDEVYHHQKDLFEKFENYLLAKLKSNYDKRDKLWHRDFSNNLAYENSVEQNRQHFLSSLGGWEWERKPLDSKIEFIQEFEKYTLNRITYTLFEDVRSDSLLLIPKSKGPHHALVVQVGVNGAPETICGFTEGSQAGCYHAIGSRLAAYGYLVIAPRMITGFAPGSTKENRVPQFMDENQNQIVNEIHDKYGRNHAKSFAPQAHAIVYMNRLCRMMGKDLKGLEMFCLSRAVDVLESLGDVKKDKIGMYGLSQGGQSALWLPALEKRIQATVVSCFFNERFTKQVMKTPETDPFIHTAEGDKIYPHLNEFGDSDIASLICPRAFFVEAGRLDSAVDWKMSQKAFSEVQTIYSKLGIPEKCEWCFHEGIHEVENLSDISELKFVKFLDKYLK
jgi:dienelactone hydrolase